jgi:hypothetical protein
MVESGVAHTSDRVVVQVIKRKQGASWRLPCAAKILFVLCTLFFFHLEFLTGVTRFQFQQVVPEPALRIREGNHVEQVSDSTVV